MVSPSAGVPQSPGEELSGEDLRRTRESQSERIRNRPTSLESANV
jgi:hypothetical protein